MRSNCCARLLTFVLQVALAALRAMTSFLISLTDQGRSHMADCVPLLFKVSSGALRLPLR
jgi:hypothetical protein